MTNLICEKDGYSLYRPLNDWDMNYHLIDEEGNDHLIDINDVCDTEEELEEYGGILWSNLSTLDDIDEVKEMVWQVDEVDKEVFGKLPV